MVGFFLGWLRFARHAAARSGMGEVKFTGQVLPTVKKVVYGVDIKRVMRSKLVLGHRRRLAVGRRRGHLQAPAISKVGLFKPERRTAAGTG